MDSYPTPDATQKSTSTESSSLRRSSRSTLSEKKHLKYDQHYHPLDQILRPSNARKRRRMHQIQPSEDDSDEYANEDEDNEETSDESNRGEPSSPFQPSRNEVPDIRRSPLGWRRSERRRTTTPIYKENVHPQDQDLREAGISLGRTKKARSMRRRRKRKASAEDLNKTDGFAGSDSAGVVDLDETLETDVENFAVPTKRAVPKDGKEQEESLNEASEVESDNSNVHVESEAHFLSQIESDEQPAAEEESSSDLDNEAHLFSPNDRSRTISPAPQIAPAEVTGEITREPLMPTDSNALTTEPSPVKNGLCSSRPKISRTDYGIKNESSSDGLAQPNELFMPTNQQSIAFLNRRRKSMNADEPLFAVLMTMEELHRFVSSGSPGHLQDVQEASPPDNGFEVFEDVEE